MSSVLITGATSGIGEALAHAYASKQHQVFACGRNEEKLTSLSTKISSLDLTEPDFETNNFKTLAFDITNVEQIKLAAAQIDILDTIILNAGDCEYIDDAVGFDNKLFQRVINVNLVAIGHLLHYLLPKLSNGGQLVLVSSSVTILPLPRAEAYGASKAGLDYLANTLRLDLAKHNIGVTLIHPGFVKTPLTDKNDFAMPFRITSEEAADRIYKAERNKRSYAHFPKRFTYLLKLMALIPKPLWQKLLTWRTS
ncbi:SDR family NAD(P)-dependent oxidoreductase [Thalassotalea crassostreae]|uniref:SDR family NAD(P)-dependent oxidoreductase n=1 Tax=Thalassotalea crassostreae TaxID=1763536 RepID=UPI000837C16D|nr:SDR family NAD(P)-dependent oxidoreductase [Thalassotalea crassostreae]